MGGLGDLLPQCRRPVERVALLGVLDHSQQPAVVQDSEDGQRLVICQFREQIAPTQQFSSRSERDHPLGERGQDELVGGDRARVATPLDAFDVACHRPAGDDRRLGDLVRLPAEQHSPSRATEHVVCTTDTLQHAVHRPGTLQLVNLVHAPDIDPEFERGGADEPVQRTFLKVLFHLLASLGRQ